MSEFEIIGLEFVEPVKRSRLDTKDKFVEFFIIYYEYSFYDECIAELFETVPELKGFLMNALDEICVSLDIDYSKQYGTLSDDTIKRIWWYLQLALTEELFKVTKSVFVLNTISKLKNNICTLNVNTLEAQMIFVNILLDDTPFAPRPAFNISSYGFNFEEVKANFMKVYQANKKSFSLRKLKSSLIFPYELTSKYLTDDEIYYDLFIMFLFEVLPLDDSEGEDALSVPIIEFLKQVCLVNKITEKLIQQLIDCCVDFAYAFSNNVNAMEDND
jgi:hypothetical protein